jgi:mRNA interferase RelE/StbE
VFKISLTPSSEKQLSKLPDNIYLQIRKLINVLKEHPYPAGCKKLNNIDGFRVRTGKYRILYTVDSKLKSIVIYKIGHRKDVYR